MASVAPPAVVAGSTRTALPHGLFPTIQWRPSGADRWESGVVAEFLHCEPAGGIGPDCGDTVTGLPKEFPGGSGTATASQFTVYGHWKCSPVGWTPEQAQARALDHLFAREEQRVEQAYWTGDLDNAATLRGATALATGAAQTLSTGIGLLEEWLGAVYGSLGVIHVTRTAATALLGADLASASGQRLTTGLGTPVAAGGGYDGSGPAAEVPAAGTVWAYASPPLFGYRSDPFPSSSRSGDLLDKGVNDLYAVAERTYLLGAEPCGAAAVLLTLP